MVAENPPGKFTVIFDEIHGQPNWSQTGFTSRQRRTNFSGMVELLARLGGECSSHIEKPLFLPETRLLVIPTPTGAYDQVNECWQREPAALFESDEICHILGFLRNGGRLLAFAYRFGDSFTQTNLGHLFAPLGCLLNDDAIVDLERLQTTHPLQSLFETGYDLLPLSWASAGVEKVLWRHMATFTIVPGADVRPLAFSPGGCCITYNRTQRQISFQSLPIAVAGLYGRGRFAFFGGPHAFETGSFGLLPQARNARFLENILHWLLSEEPLEDHPSTPSSKGEEWRLRQAADQNWLRFSRILSQGEGEAAVAFVDRLLRDTGVLKALSRAKWLP